MKYTVSTQVGIIINTIMKIYMGHQAVFKYIFLDLLSLNEPVTTHFMAQPPPQATLLYLR